MQFIYLVPLLFLSFLASAKSRPSICYFDLSTEQNEGYTLKNNVEEQHGVSVYAFKAGENAEEAFKNMISSTNKNSQACDSLVISGHHTGSWHHGPNNTLDMRFLEKLSCDEKYKKWFSKIKALWLWGCNTVENKTGKKQKKDKEITADTEVIRIMKKERAEDIHPEDKLYTQVRNLNFSYSNVLDKHAPLSLRYMRIFPNTNVYGYSGSAPLNSNTKNPILEHIKLTSAVAKTLDSNNDSIVKGLNMILQADLENICAGWEKGNQQSIKNVQQKELIETSCELMQAIDAYKKDPNNSKNINRIVKSLEQVKNQDIEASHALMNRILYIHKASLRASQRENNPNTMLEEKLKEAGLFNENSPIVQALKQKIQTQEIGILRKVTYLKFYSEIQKKDKFYLKTLNNILDTIDISYADAGNPQTRLLYFLAADNLYQSDFIDERQLIQIVQKLAPNDSKDLVKKLKKINVNYDADIWKSIINRVYAR